MHLVYFDESGNTGNNLNDSQQPVFVLGALLVPAASWQGVEQALEASLQRRFPAIHRDEEEVHAGDLRNGSRMFKGVAIEDRVGLRDDWMSIAARHSLRFVFRSIVKKRYEEWLHTQFGEGVSINPHIAAFALLANVVNDHLTQEQSLGIFISDENKEIVRDVEKAIRSLRLTKGPLQLSQVIEKGFFIDSKKSRILQLADMCVLHARKHEEAKLGLPAKDFDRGVGIKLEGLLLKQNERFRDVIAWLKQQRSDRSA